MIQDRLICAMVKGGYGPNLDKNHMQAVSMNEMPDSKEQVRKQIKQARELLNQSKALLKQSEKLVKQMQKIIDEAKKPDSK